MKIKMVIVTQGQKVTNINRCHCHPFLSDVKTISDAKCFFPNG
jgi:hypothetical protein